MGLFKQPLRLLSVILSVAILAVSLLSCQKVDVNSGSDSDNVLPSTDTAPTIQLELAQFGIVFPEASDTLTLSAATKLLISIKKCCDYNRMPINDQIAAENNAKEILVGVTNRPMSDQAISELTTSGFIIKFSENNIAIVASSSKMLETAVDYFIANILFNVNNGVLSIEKDYKYIFTKDGIDFEDYSVYYPAGDQYNYFTEALNNLVKQLNMVWGTDINASDDKRRSAGNSEYEILIGNMDCSEVKAVQNQLLYNQYGVLFRGNKIIVYGHTLGTQLQAMVLFKEMVSNCVSIDSSGTPQAKQLERTDVIKTLDEWFVDIPNAVQLYPTIQFSGCLDSDENIIQSRYTKADKSVFDGYCAAMLKEGYSQHSTNTLGNVSTSIFRKNGCVVWVSYYSHDNVLKIITSPTDEVLYTENSDSYTVVCKPSVTQLCIDYTNTYNGMCYIIQLEDGRFIIVDGGHEAVGDSKHLLDKLNELNANTGREKPVIAAWLFTHLHSDHVYAFREFSSYYGKKVVLESIMLNNPEKTISAETNHSSVYYTEMRKYLTYYSKEPDMFIPQTGEVMSMSGATIEILYTQHDYYPTKFMVYNDAGLVFRVTVNGQSVLFLGDIQTTGALKLNKMYHTALKSDMVQMAHHGFDNGASKETYTLISPAIAFWPSGPYLYERETSISSRVGYYVAKILQSVKRVIPAAYEDVTVYFGE